MPEEPAAAAETEVLRERRCLGRVVAEDAVEAVWAAMVIRAAVAVQESGVEWLGTAKGGEAGTRG